MYDNHNWAVPQTPEQWVELRKRLSLHIGEKQAEIIIHYSKFQDVSATSEKFGVSTSYVLSLYKDHGMHYDGKYSSRTAKAKKQIC